MAQLGKGQDDGAAANAGAANSAPISKEVVSVSDDADSMDEK